MHEIYSSKQKPVIPNSHAIEKILKKCKDHINTTGAFNTTCILFAALFLYGMISFY